MSQALRLMLRNMFGPERDEVTGEWGNCVMRRCMFCTVT